MKHNIFKYVAIAAALLATAVNAGAQTYNHENGVSTSKQVTGPDTNGNYTIRLETFATGTTTVTETATPVDVVLVLDVSGSMDYSKGTPTRYSQYVTYDDVLAGNQTYFVSQGGNYQKVYAKTETRREYRNRRWVDVTYYQLYRYPADPQVFVENESKDQCRSNQLYIGTTRMQELQKAVGAFIDNIELKDQIKDDDGNVTGRVGHRIGIVKFASNTTTTVGNDTYESGDYILNYSQIVMNLTNVEGNVDAMKAEVNSFQSMGGTQAGYGMAHANTVLASAIATHNKVVVFFTDGNPDDSFAAIGSASGNQGAGTNAYRAKNAQGAVVYSIGMFTNSPSATSDTYAYLNNVSSNYPKATVNNGNMNAGAGSDQGYYQDASGDIDLTAIFTSISEGIGGAETTVGTSTQVRDVVTNSFVLPSDISAADVHVYTSAATGSASGADDTDPEGWATPVEITNSVTKNIVNVDANGKPTSNPDEVKNKALFIEGFDYSKADSAEGEGDGNWVGPRFKNNNWTWAGKKVIITFKVKADGEATGGESQTNTGNSGVWVKNEDGTYTCVNHYAEPHTTLTVNIKIRKTGLRSGESATFELMRIRPKGYNPDGATLKDRVANLEYNLIGKPKPGTHESTDPSLSPTDADPSKYYESIGWKSFKKVILTNLSDTNGKEVIKDILALDPYWVYMVVEDDWGWAYTMTGDTNQVGEDGTYTTSTVEVNPFRFHNTEKTGVVKHAEAVMINHFQSVEEGASSYTEHKKSSKTKF